ncbi:SDR family NAD(P)-dependent oxidoreductase [Lunatibacter salilacus]|uniref:SDR family NAD(P)-dependent oxidoreductase n=1 Tax=Lunatibacter salilacus TaxID=2483804 RepID=UPI00131DE9E9|nr:SDR family NAD(P)-dependent oxidoreductase [Lunatibacter salilacus]
MAKKLYIVTGSSKGLGKALVTQLLEDLETYIIGISRQDEPSKDRYTHLSLDLSDTDKLVNALDEIFPSGNYDELTLINNAGWIGEIAPIGKLNPQGILDIHRINLVAPAILMNAFTAAYRKSSAKKTVINISSGAAGKAVDGWSGYCASKAALNQMTLVAQQEAELHQLGIRYIALSPGIIDTPMQENIRSASSENFSQVRKFQGFKAENQLSSPAETAGKVIFLLRNLDAMPGVLLDVREF